MLSVKIAKLICFFFLLKNKAISIKLCRKKCVKIFQDTARLNLWFVFFLMLNNVATCYNAIVKQRLAICFRSRWPT
jgi:hypothetical protein